MRAELARILVNKPDVILLDEPTNHLDIISISWLENYLQKFDGIVIVISHDRLFLDNVTKRTLEISKGKILDYPYSYSQYKIKREEDLARLTDAKKQQDKDIKQTKELIDKFRAKANKAAFAQSLMKKLDRTELIEVDAGDFDGAIKLRDELSEKNGWFNGNQFANPKNIEAHYHGTGVELMYQCRCENIKPTAFVAGTGTGGTIMGTGKLLKEQFNEIQLVAVEPEESPVMSGGQPGLHGIQGIGDGSKFMVNLKEVDDIIIISTEEAKERAKRLSKEQGLFVGISSGANILASERLLEKYPDMEGNIITILCDRGERYLSCF